jgi:prephenate dehydrogenase
MAERRLPVISPPAAPPIFDKIGIVGLGLIGGSIALAARQIWPAALVIAVDDKSVLEKAMVLHAIDVAADDLIVLAEADLVVLAAPVRENIRLLGEVAEAVKGEAIVTDTGSTKRLIAAAAERLPPRLTFVGGHPLAGAATRGIEHARPDLFRDRPWIFTTDASASVAALERLERFVGALGAEPHRMNAAEHDRLLASLSHLPQLTASALMRIVGETAGAQGLALSGRGLVDTTRLAGSPADIWRDIVETNADQLQPLLDLLIAELQELREDLSVGARLEETFEAANRWRAILTGRNPRPS